MSGTNVLYSILWFIVLVCIAWPVSWFCAWWWVILIAFEGFFAFIKDATDFLEKIVSWPRVVGSAMVRGDKRFPSPF
eukprot:CAMPEP_0196143718 /NCGR_PEP_ID=MMETSP0910-20130528/13680_1 /TAXON_ID=49265 /ORGANISM="Thalassiosira rotula, Strain GSO102" /LENGTH=76 /DNA_ID=CAMNT_0041405205 /DNA_START=106 /DNA_END=336 /DNA_ORIENTATION=+